MNFQQTIFMNNTNTSSSSKGKSPNASRSSGNADFYKIIQSLSSSSVNNGNQRINAANSSGDVSKANAEIGQISSDTNVDAEIAGMNDIIDENIINEAIGAKSSGAKTEKAGEVKFSAEEIKALVSDKDALMEISEELNIPMEVIEAFLAQLTLQTAGEDPVSLPDIINAVNAVNNAEETTERADFSVKEDFLERLSREDFIEKLKKFAEMSENDRTAEKYSGLNEFMDAVKNAVELSDAARKLIKPNNFANAVHLNGTADEAVEFVTEKILEHLNVDADSLSDFEIVSIEKLLNENLQVGERFESLLQKLRNPLAGMTRFREVSADASVMAAESTGGAEIPELIPVSVNTAVNEIAHNADETVEADISEDTVPVSSADEVPDNTGMINGNMSVAAEEIKQYPDVITHYTRAVNNIQNLILNNKSGENFQVKMLLRPEGLGEMLVRVTYNKGNISLNISTDNSLAQRELINQATDLRNTLAEHNFSLMNFDVGNKNPDDRNQYSREDGRKNKNNARTINGINSDGDGNIKVSTEDIIRLRGIYQDRTVYKRI